MTFRLRLTLLVAVAVAVAVIGASSLTYFAVRNALFGQVDQTLRQAATVTPTSVIVRDPSRPFGGWRGPSPARAEVFAQIVNAEGRVIDSTGTPSDALVSEQTKRVAAGTASEFFADVTVEGARVRLFTMPLGSGLALQVTRPLDEVERALGQIGLTLVLVALGGILLAAGLGAVVARTALAPVARLTSTVEEVTRTSDLSRRVATTRTDELGRLAESFNRMLAALETSVRSQRQLVADASHELRTPITSLRTNLEVLARGQPIDDEDRRRLLRDLVSQMERLSHLVGDLIDLARQEEAPLSYENLRLDEVVQRAVANVRTQWPGVRFEVEARPSVVRGAAERIDRAVSNLLDNAAKWSPPGGVVEVAVRDGEVVVRDHGAGVDVKDAPHVFQRFWRAATARHLPGSGLGLAIVQSIAHAHGGSVTLEHPADGGARFRLRFRSSGAGA